MRSDAETSHDCDSHWSLCCGLKIHTAAAQKKPSLLRSLLLFFLSSDCAWSFWLCVPLLTKSIITLVLLKGWERKRRYKRKKKEWEHMLTPFYLTWHINRQTFPVSYYSCDTFKTELEHCVKRLHHLSVIGVYNPFYLSLFGIFNHSVRYTQLYFLGSVLVCSNHCTLWTPHKQDLLFRRRPSRLAIAIWNFCQVS